MLLRCLGPRGSRPASLAFGILAFSAPCGALHFPSIKYLTINGDRKCEDTHVCARFLPVTTGSRGAAVKRLGEKQLDAGGLDFVDYQARHATFTGGTANFFFAMAARRAGERIVLDLEDMDTCSVVTSSSRNDNGLQKDMRSWNTYLL